MTRLQGKPGFPEYPRGERFTGSCIASFGARNDDPFMNTQRNHGSQTPHRTKGKLRCAPSAWCKPSSYACRRAGAAQGGASTPSGCCSRRGCARPRAACRRRSGAADRGEFLQQRSEDGIQRTPLSLDRPSSRSFIRILYEMRAIDVPGLSERCFAITSVFNMSIHTFRSFHCEVALLRLAIDATTI